MDTTNRGITVGVISPHPDTVFTTEAVSHLDADVPVQSRLIGRWAGDDGLGMAMVAGAIPEGERNLAAERVFSAFWGNDPATITDDDPGEPKIIYGPVWILGLNALGVTHFTEDHAATLAPMLEKLRQDAILKQFEQDLLDTEITELENLL